MAILNKLIMAASSSALLEPEDQEFGQEIEEELQEEPGSWIDWKVHVSQI